MTLKDKVRIIDIGGTRGYWDLASDELKKRMSITLVNYEVALNLKRVENDLLDVEYHEGDGCDLHDFADGSFDLAHSNSVIEHVRLLSNTARFADEMCGSAMPISCRRPTSGFPTIRPTGCCSSTDCPALPASC